MPACAPVSLAPIVADVVANGATPSEAIPSEAIPKSQSQSKLKRPIVVSLAVLITATLVGWATWSFAVPHYRPSLRRGEAYGIDVSHHQGKIDWQRVAADHISFAYLKATEGGDHVDSRFRQNAGAAGAAGLGAYHFFTFCRSGADQAANFLAVAPPNDRWLAPAVDIEFGGNCAKRPSRDELVKELRVFVAMVESAWTKPLVSYVLYDTERRYQLASELRGSVWQRRLFHRPSRSTWSFWQVSGFAHVGGVKGPVDLNVSRIDLFESIE